jgi:hypothetical protein
MVSLLTALAVLLLTLLAEWLHVRRIRAVGRLAFGPAGAPNRWTRIVPFLRPLCLTAFAWGLVTLLMLNIAPAENKVAGNKEATRLVFVADLSPSMNLTDAGPDGKQTRQARMREVVEGILQHVSGNLRFGVAASAPVYALIPVALEFFGSDWKIGGTERVNKTARRKAC